MSPIGRIFSVLNLVLAAVFLAWASNTLATSQQWKQKHQEVQTAKDQLETELNERISTLQTDIDRKQGENARLANNLEQTEQDKNRVQDDLKDAKKENSELNASVDRLSNSIDSLEANNRDLVAQKDQEKEARFDAENRAKDAEAAMQEANTEVENVQQQNLVLNNTISDLEKQLASAKGEISGLETQVAQLVDLTGATLGDIIPQKRINGAVLKALYDVPPGLVALNVGSDDGVVRGNTFEIYNGTQYKGRVRVENVRPDMSTCLILDTVEGQVIKQGDQAATVL
jgi:hypothetical protein